MTELGISAYRWCIVSNLFTLHPVSHNIQFTPLQRVIGLLHVEYPIYGGVRVSQHRIPRVSYHDVIIMTAPAQIGLTCTANSKFVLLWFLMVRYRLYRNRRDYFINTDVFTQNDSAFDKFWLITAEYVADIGLHWMSTMGVGGLKVS